MAGLTSMAIVWMIVRTQFVFVLVDIGQLPMAKALLAFPTAIFGFSMDDVTAKCLADLATFRLFINPSLAAYFLTHTATHLLEMDFTTAPFVAVGAELGIVLVETVHAVFTGLTLILHAHISLIF